MKFKLIFCLFPLQSLTAFSNDINVNIFEKYCDSKNSSFFTNCNFKNINLYPYSTMQKRELTFNVNYEFKNCNFSYLNTQLSTNQDYYKINSGIKSIALNGYTLKLNETYFWDTNTNNYNKSCSFKINSIKTCFSNYTKTELENYVAIINENKIFIEEIESITPLLSKISRLISSLKTDNITRILDSIVKEIDSKKNLYTDDPVFTFTLENINYEIELFKKANPYASEENSIDDFKNKITKLLNELFFSIDTNQNKKNISYSKSKISEIIDSVKDIPNFEQSDIIKYKQFLIAQ